MTYEEGKTDRSMYDWAPAFGCILQQHEQIETIGDGAKPCSTLFIANLGPNCTKDELQQVLSQ